MTTGDGAVRKIGMVVSTAIAGLLGPAGTLAQSEALEGVEDRVLHQIFPATSGIEIDGVIVEDAWRGAARVELAYETSPGDNTEAPAQTVCFLTFDTENLYFACEADDPDPSDIRAFISDRDGIIGHDRISLIIDPFNDARRAFNFTVSALGVHSDTEYPDSLALARNQKTGSFGGDLGMLRLDYNTRDWVGQFRLGFHSPDLRTDAGFIPQVGMRQIWLSADRVFWGAPGDIFSRIFVRGGYWRREGYVGGLVGDDLWMHFDSTGPLQSSVLIIPRKLRASFGDRLHDISDFNVITNFRPTAKITAGFTWNVGGAIDVANARRADRVSLRPSLGLRLGRRFDFSLSHDIRRLSYEGAKVFDASVTELRAIYNLSARAFLRAIVQHRATSRNPDQFPGEVRRTDRTIDSQLLFSYKLNPQSVFLLGYDDGRQGGTEFDLLELPITQVRRTFFMKLSYAWRP